VESITNLRFHDGTRGLLHRLFIKEELFIGYGFKMVVGTKSKQENRGFEQ
jgi:hypothetical protein